MKFNDLTEKELNNKHLNNMYSPNEVLFITGSGISAADPCGFFLGNELYQMILKYYSSMSSSEINEFLDKEARPAFELATEIALKENNIRQKNAYHILSGIFSNYSLGKIEEFRNDYHKFFHSHILQGGQHITVNIDQFIEMDGRKIQVLTKETVDCQDVPLQPANILDSGFLLKIHGDSNIDALGKEGFLHDSIKDGFSENMKSLLDTIISSSKLVVFVGCGGVDDFDITPYFQEKQNAFFKNTNAIWIEYSEQQSIEKVTNISEAQQAILKCFKGSEVLRVAPNFILNKLFKDQSFSINNIKRENGYRKEYEEFFAKSIAEQLAECMIANSAYCIKEHAARLDKTKEKFKSI